MLPVRDVVDAFAPTEYVIVPGPLPVAPAVMAIHPALAAAVHEQPAVVVTVTVAVPPSVGIPELAGEMVYEHTGVGSVGDVLLQPMKAADTNAASDAQEKSLEFMAHLTHAQQAFGQCMAGNGVPGIRQSEQCRAPHHSQLLRKSSDASATTSAACMADSDIYGSGVALQRRR
jgi:hypothetical protein